MFENIIKDYFLVDCGCVKRFIKKKNNKNTLNEANRGNKTGGYEMNYTEN